MNKNEQLVKEKYRKMGHSLNKKGWPDFYFFINGQLTVIEVKARSDDLSFEQRAVQKFLESHGVRYIIEYIKDNSIKTVYDSSKQTKLHRKV